MGFLDNSGDIILDAVLTDVGRKRMAQGNFKITKFAIGDDEIDYGLYNKAHASGSAYYDLQILQTPVMEAFTQTNAGINYGLLTVTATDLLYLPVLDINDKGLSSTVVPNATYGKDLYYIADPTADTPTNLTTDLGDTKYYAISNATTGPAILIEAGLNTTDLKGTAANRKTYLLNSNLVDNFFFVYYDNRFISTILGPTAQATFNNTNEQDGTATLGYDLKRAAPISTDMQLENYSAARIAAPTNGVLYNASDATADTATSVITGPRSSFTVLNVSINPNLATEYSKYGSVNSQVFSAGGSTKRYDYLDTILYVQGARTGIQLQVPLRIIKYKSAS